MGGDREMMNEKVIDTSTGIAYNLESEPIVSVDSRDYCTPEDASRWTVIEIYKAPKGNGGWALVQLGMSAIPGEETYARVTLCPSIAAIAEALLRHNGGRTYYTVVGKAALILAQEKLGRAEVTL